MSDCFKKNDLILPGTRQDQRLQNALDPSYVLADERSLAELLVFISKYAELINYYSLKTSNQNNYVIDGNWKPLMMSDEAFNYANISVIPYSLPNITFYKYINLYETGSTDARRKNAYRVLWDVLFSLYRDINAFYAALPISMQLRSDVAVEIKNGLAADMGIAADAYLNDAVVIPGWNLQTSTPATDDDYTFSFGKDVLAGIEFDEIWINHNLEPTADSWYDYVNKLALNSAPAQVFFNVTAIANVFDRVDYSTLQLKQIFKRVFEAYSRIISKANNYLQNSLQNNAAHYAHHGLILAFLKLFDVLKLDMNEFTRKHLEYYYSRVLQINPAPAVPDAAHIIFEPSKNITTHLIKEDTALNAGKDGIGKLMLYDTDDEIVINQAKVEQVKTLFIKPKSSNGVEKIFASPVAGSADGNGASFTGEDLSWKGFGDDLNVANLGFYIASPVLHLTEGNRYIEFIFTTDSDGKDAINNLTNDERAELFSFSFSGEKQWEPLIIQKTVVIDFNSTLNFIPASANTDGTFSFTMEITLLPQCKPVVGYDATKCDGNLSTIYPVMRFVLNQDSWGNVTYKNLQNIAIKKININTHVWDITGLSLQNDLGAVDASKPVQPFGPNPQINSTFYIGHPEIEHKDITNFFITLNWLNPNPHFENYYSYRHAVLNGGTKTYPFEPYIPGLLSNDSFKIKIDFIRNKTWKPSSTAEDSLFATPPISVSFSNPVDTPLVKSDVYKTGIIPYTTGTQNGFIRLKLLKPADAFGHALWPKLFAQQTVAVTSDPDVTHNTIPNPPYTPLLESIKLYYVARHEISFDNTYNIDQGQFFHLMPFGIKEVNDTVTLLPVFESQVKQTGNSLLNKPLESAVFIGISNAIINQNISLLLQLSEGTEDISLDAPGVTWNYLSSSGWKNFNQTSGSNSANYLSGDSTSNLIKSGIVKFQVPTDINTKATELQAGLMWVAASIEHNSAALPKMLAVLSNAVKATFADDKNDAEHLAKPLPADKITKLYESDAAVKKISQPYPSSGGKKTEEGNKFYTRVSERLRHKHRAITIWDYERLVLNEFPQVYMVKCLNHTGYIKNCIAGNDTYRENIPGKVMLVTIPFVTNLQTGNKLKPALSGAVLSDITDFISGNNNAGTCNKYMKALKCSLAELKVVNPKYETIKVNCKIKVKPCLDQQFYEQQLPADLKNFLSPWITGDATKINFGGRLHVSQVIYFIEQLSYIDYVTNVTIEHADETGILNISEPSLAVTTTSMSVLTSSDSHNISPA